MAETNQDKDAHIQLLDSTSRTVRLSTSYNPVGDYHQLNTVSITTEHQKIHSGNAYVHSDVHTVGNGATLTHLIKGHATTQCHLRVYTYTVEDTPCTVVLYEAPTTTDDGTEETWYNANRISSNTADTQLFVGPTVTDNGSEIETVYYPPTGFGFLDTGARGIDIGNEWVFNASTDYLLQLTNNSGGSINIQTFFFMYEV